MNNTVHTTCAEAFVGYMNVLRQDMNAIHLHLAFAADAVE